MSAPYTRWAEEHGGDGETPEKEARCYRCQSWSDLHLEGRRFACRVHCDCPKGKCHICGHPPVLALGLCRACYRFKRRNGRDRTEEELRALSYRRFLAESEREIVRKGLIRA